MDLRIEARGRDDNVNVALIAKHADRTEAGDGSWVHLVAVEKLRIGNELFFAVNVSFRCSSVG